MKIFENKSVFKKLIIVLLIIMIFSFCMPKNVKASDDGIGGKLLSPVIDLLIGLGDGALNVIHTVVYHQNDTLLTVDMTNSVLAFLATITVGILAAVVVAAAVVLTAGALAAAAASIGITLSAVGVGTVLVVSTTAGVVGAAVFNSNVLPDDLQLPVYSISPEEIFSDEILLLDVDFFNPKKSKTLEDGTEMESTAKQLRSIISDWYKILRDISLVALLSILVYTGIRILISSTSNDKAKYKQLLVDWIVAVCLLFIMQYIMSFSNLLVGKVTDIFKSTKYDNGYVAILEDENGKIEKALTDGGYDVNSLKYQEDGKNYIQWKTNLLGVARLNAQMAKSSSTSYAGYALIFVVLVLFSIYFIFTYLKRVLYMAFLTLIAPLVALTYPIDKMADGKAQAFNSWIKEYIFNLLIQPMHLLLYTILVSSAFELASTNIIYSLVALAFMIPAEKLLRKFFGFNKAETPGALGGAAGAAVMMSGINKLLHKPPKGKGESKSGKKGDSSSDSNDNSAIKYKDNFDTDSTLFGNNVEQDSNFLGEKESNTHSSFNLLNNNGISGSDNNSFEDKWDMPIEDRIINGKEQLKDKINSGYGQMRDSFNDTSLGKGINKVNTKVNEGKRNIKNKVSNSRLGRTVRNSRTIQAGKEGIKFYGKGLRDKVENKLNNSHPLRAVPKVAAGVATGVAAGSIGLAAGIASGDISKTAQYAAGAAVGGYAFGGSVGKSVSGVLAVDGAEEAIKEAYYGEDVYKEKQIQKNIEKVQKDDKLKRELSKRLGNQEEADNALKEIVPTSVRYGLENANEIAAVYERRKMGENMDTAVAQVKYVSEYGKNTSKLGHKDSEELNKTIMDRVRKNSKPGTSEKQMQENARQLREKFDATSKVVYKKL